MVRCATGNFPGHGVECPHQIAIFGSSRMSVVSERAISVIREAIVGKKPIKSYSLDRD